MSLMLNNYEDTTAYSNYFRRKRKMGPLKGYAKDIRTYEGSR